jgi:DNA-directed RNA polymerase
MQPVLDALNHLQSPAFTINKPVLKFMKWLGFSRPSPVRVDFKTDDECKWALEEWRNILQSWRLDIAIADYLATQDQFYIPLALQFRGRAEPVPYFHYQRGDDIRGLFLVRDGEPMGAGDRSYEWLLSYAAARADGNQWGGIEKPSKLRLKRRFDWAQDNLKTIRRIGAGVLSGAFDEVLPLIDGIEDRCQFIATCVEIENLQRALESGSEFITHLPILMDMSNSALQHWGTLVRAPETDYANLNGNLEPDDYYARVAADVHGTGHEATCLMKSGTDRGVVKGAVVAHSYGSRPGRIERKRIVRDSNVVVILSPTGMSKSIVKALKERGPLPDGWEKHVPKLASLALHADNKRTPYVQGAKKFINAIARLYSKHGLDWRWPTKLGLPVVNIYRKRLTKRVRYYDFKTQKWRKKKLAIGYSNEIDALKANKAAGANFIHSMDGVGAHLGMIALEAAKENMQLISIHDCFGCLATRAGRLHAIVRETLVRLHEDDEQLLSDILERAAHDLPKNVKLPPLPKTGNQDISKIRISHNLCK